MKNKIIIITTLVFVFGLVFVVSRANAHAATNNGDSNEQDMGIIVQAQTNSKQTEDSHMNAQNSENENDYSDSEDSSSDREDNNQNEKELEDKQDHNSNSEDSSNKKEDNNESKNEKELGDKQENNSNSEDSSNKKEDNNQNENEKGDQGENGNYQKMSEERKSVVANAVAGMLKIADTNKGIGEQVKVIAQDQSSYQDAIEKSLGEAEDRSSITKFFIGPNYNKINEAKKLLQKSKVQVDQLNQIKSQVTNKDVAQKLTNQITLLKKVSAQTDKLIKESESTFSLFGWLVKMFS